MKVLMVATWYSEKNAPVISAGVFHYEQAMALKAYCDTALYFPYDLNESYSKAQEHGLLTYRTRVQCNSLSKRLQRRRQYLQNLQRVLADYQPDIVHAHCSLPGGRAAFRMLKRMGVPVVITEHRPINMMQLHKLPVKRSHWHLYRDADAATCVSKDLQQQLKQLLRLDLPVIYNGVSDPINQVRADRTYRVEGAINCCIAAGFYAKDIKGYQFLLPAIAELQKAGKYVVLHICGGGEYLSHYQQLAQQLGITDRCIFYGQCDKPTVYSIMAQMDFCVSASLFESAGVSVEESMLLGKPLVVTRSGGASSLVTQQSAIIVDTGSAKALYDGIVQMINRQSAYDSQAIRAYGLENFEMKQVCQAHMALYNQVLSNHGKR